MSLEGKVIGLGLGLGLGLELRLGLGLRRLWLLGHNVIVLNAKVVRNAEEGYRAMDKVKVRVRVRARVTYICSYSTGEEGLGLRNCN